MDLGRGRIADPARLATKRGLLPGQLGTVHERFEEPRLGGRLGSSQPLVPFAKEASKLLLERLERSNLPDPRR